MAKRNGKSSGEGIIKFANVIQVILSILCVFCGGIMIAAGIYMNNGGQYSNIGQYGVPTILCGVLFIVLGLIFVAIYAMFMRCFGEMAVDLHCIRNSNATLAEFVDNASIARHNKEQQ